MCMVLCKTLAALPEWKALGDGKDTSFSTMKMISSLCKFSYNLWRWFYLEHMPWTFKSRYTDRPRIHEYLAKPLCCLSVSIFCVVYWIKTIEKFLFCSQQVLGLLSHYWYYKWKVIRKPGLQKNMQFSTLCCLWKPGQQALMRNHHQAAGLLTLFVNTIFQSLFIGNREKKQWLLLKSFFFVNMWS